MSSSQLLTEEAKWWMKCIEYRLQSLYKSDVSESHNTDDIGCYWKRKTDIFVSLDFYSYLCIHTDIGSLK